MRVFKWIIGSLCGLILVIFIGVYAYLRSSLPDYNGEITVAGISGNFMGPHYDDQAELWRTGKYRPFVLDRKSIEADARYKLKMLPG